MLSRKGSEKKSSSSMEVSDFHGVSNERLVALFLFGWALFNFPLLVLWDQNLVLWGLPFFPLMLFIIWTLLIAGVAWLMERSNH